MSVLPSIASYNGFGEEVDWFFVLKLPMNTFPATELWRVEASQGYVDYASLNLSAAHCDCPDPTCEEMPFPEYGAYKGSGLCYLYADSNHPELRYFRDVKDADGNSLECLGQGGRDPLSETLIKGINNEESYAGDYVEWAYWNDEFQATSSSYKGDVCNFNAYSPEALPYTTCEDQAECGSRCSASPYGACATDEDCTSGTCKEITCATKDLPAYNNGCGSPYGHSKGALAFGEGRQGFLLQATTPNWPDPSTGATFAPLGCQLDNNTMLSQHFMSLTLDAATFRAAAPALAAARLCGTGTTSCATGSAGHDYPRDFYCSNPQTRDQPWSILQDVFSGTSTTGVHSVSLDAATSGGVPFKLLSHSQEDKVPPWYFAAATIGADLGVASWWEYQYGFGSLCSGDDYTLATSNMCLVSEELGIGLTPTGGAAQSVENAIAAAFTINGVQRAWGLWGEFGPVTSHAKFGVASTLDPSEAWVVGGDENNQGFGCSTTCEGSQNGRGGLFFALNNATLHASFYRMVKIVCACNDVSKPERRFCYFGCYHKDTSAQLPSLPAFEQSSSFWDLNQKAWYP